MKVLTPQRIRVSTAVISAAIAVAATLLVQQVKADGAPTTGALTYTGLLATNDGNVINGTKNIGLSIHDAPTGGNRLCDAVSASVTVYAGRFQISLPDECVAIVKSRADVWVDVQIEGGSVGRTKLGAVPYALEASNAIKAATAASAQTAASAVVAASAASAQSAVSLRGPVTVIESASSQVETGTFSTDFVYQGVSVDLTPGTWLVEAEATLRTTDVPDTLAIGLVDATTATVTEIVNSRSALETIGTIGTSSYVGSVALHTSKVVSVSSPITIIRIKGYRNGSSTLQFGVQGDVALAGGRNRIYAVRLSE